MRTSVIVVAMSVASALACASSPPTPAPRPVEERASAPVSATSEKNASLGNLFGGGRGLPPCLRSARFEGVATADAGELRVQLYRPSIGVERHNDKRADLLTLRVQVADGRHVLGYDANLEYRLSPTVDSAGPQITTWQGGDTLRMLLPWPKGIGARWLLFFFNYRATTYSGDVSDCGAIIRSDTLRFGATPTSSR